MLTKWTKTCILIMINIIIIEANSPWTHYQKSYTGGCISTGNSKPSCIDLGEHAYRGHLLDEPPKGPKFYLDDLEPFDEDYLPFERIRRSSKRKESKHQQESIDNKEMDEEDDDEEEEEKMEKPVRKERERKKGKKKRLEEKVEKEDEDDDELDEDEEGTDDAETGEDEKEVMGKK